MRITKGPGCQQVVGMFAELATCMWLARSGFAVAHVSQVGIDVLASRRRRRQRLGITVKSRLPSKGKEAAAVKLFETGDREKLHTACADFGCEPWIAVYVETEDYADFYLTSLTHFDAAYHSRSWQMSRKAKGAYDRDPHVAHVRLDFRQTSWPE